MRCLSDGQCLRDTRAASGLRVQDRELPPHLPRLALDIMNYVIILSIDLRVVAYSGRIRPCG
jgi:hypothetical protein